MLYFEYYLDGRLKTWLEHRFYSSEVNKLEMLEGISIELISEKLCKVFGFNIKKKALM